MTTPTSGGTGPEPQDEAAQFPGAHDQPFGYEPYGSPQSYGPPQPYGPPQYGPPGAYGPPPPPNHPRSTLAMVLGIVGLAGGLICYLPILCAPFAWFIGRKARSEMDAEPGRWSGHGAAQAGLVLGIIGTVILILVAVGLTVLFTVLASVESSSP